MKKEAPVKKLRGSRKIFQNKENLEVNGQERDMDGVWTLRYTSSSKKNKVRASFWKKNFEWLYPASWSAVELIKKIINPKTTNTEIFSYRFSAKTLVSYLSSIYISRVSLPAFFQIIRLVPTSRVYVSEFALTNAIRNSNSITTLARNLLPVVFTEKALQLCYATERGGAKAARQMLHQEGMETLYAFVKNHAESKTNWCPLPAGWKKDHLKEMKSSVTKKLNESKKTVELNKVYDNLISV